MDGDEGHADSTARLLDPGGGRFRLLVQSVRDCAIFMLDPLGPVLTWNSGAERITGYCADDIIGRDVSEFHPPEARARELRNRELEIAALAGSVEEEGWRARKDGSLFWANIVITAMRDPSGRLVGFAVVMRDATHRHDRELALRQSEAWCRLLVDCVSECALLVLDVDGRVVTWNVGARRIKGYSAAEILGRHFAVFYPPEARDGGWPDHGLRVAAKAGSFADTGWRVRKDGTSFWADVNITALRDETGHLMGFAELTRDLTEGQTARATEPARQEPEESLGDSPAKVALSVAYLSANLQDPGEREHAGDAIEILIPGDNAALCATYRTGEGREFNAFVRAPMIAVIPPGQVYRVSSDHAADTLVLRLAAEFFDAQVRAALGTPPPRVAARFAAFDPFIRELGDALQERLQHAQPLGSAYVQAIAGVISLHLARHYGIKPAMDTAPVGLPEHKLRRVRAFVDEHMAEVLHVDQLAEVAKLSPYHFARMFKRTTGQTPHLYVLMQRVERAKALLSDSETALIDIAAHTGFQTQGHFSGVFRRYTGQTPRAFRLACRAAQPG